MTMLEGGQRTRPRQEHTVRGYLARLLPVLTAWSATIGHLREVTRDDITAALAEHHGQQAQALLTALRSLFRHCRRAQTIFKDPTRGIRRGPTPRTLALPLSEQASGTVIRTVRATGSPRAAVVVALAAIHAARLKAIRHIQLDDIDLPNQRLVINGHSRPLDELTARAILAWLTYRREHWPDSPNRHLLISKHTAVESGPMSHFALEEILRGSGVSLERLRINRNLEEALTHDGDPLHLMAVFGMSDTAAIRYAASARALLHEPTADSDSDTHTTHG
jgi:integrase